MFSQDVVASGREVVEVSIKGSVVVIAPSAAEVFGGGNWSKNTSTKTNKNIRQQLVFAVYFLKAFHQRKRSNSIWCNQESINQSIGTFSRQSMESTKYRSNKSNSFRFNPAFASVLRLNTRRTDPRLQPSPGKAGATASPGETASCLIP